MPAKPLSPPGGPDVIWLCRRLASALQSETHIWSALDAAASDASGARQRLLVSIRDHVSSGGRISEALRGFGCPSFVWGTAKAGESQNTPAAALTLVADRLEAEEAAEPGGNRTLRSYAIALGRLGVMLQAGVAILMALEAAADAAPQSRPHAALLAARDAVREGADLSDAFARVAPDLPEMTADMLRDAEREGRLGEALPIIADYILDAAHERRAGRRKQEVHDA